MTIRAATTEDLKDIYALALEAHEKSDTYRDIPVDEQKLKKLLLMMVFDKTSCVFVSEDHSGITGFVLGMVDELFFSRKRYGTDLMIYSRSPFDGARLVRKLVEWIKSKPRVVEITLGVTSGIGDPERVGMLYQRVGFKRIGGTYMMKLMESQK